VIASAFTYEAPTDEAGLRAALRGGPTVLGGGTWVVPELSQGVRAAERIVDLCRMGLDGISSAADDVWLGSMTTYAAILRSTEGDGQLRLLRRMAGGITGGPQLRNVATVGGSAAYATPSSEVPAVLVVLDAAVHVMGPDGDRELPATEFFVDAFSTRLADDEVIRGFALPSLPAATHVGYVKLKLSESSYPIATAAAHGELDGDGALARVRLAVGAACTVPLLVPIDDLVTGLPPAEAAPLVADRVRELCAEPYADVLADGPYRREVAGVAAKRAILQLAEAA
jgi:carbon-monoxide dehydrogenase medium subunit